jgi:hypothetical protein
VARRAECGDQVFFQNFISMPGSRIRRGECGGLSASMVNRNVF